MKKKKIKEKRIERKENKRKKKEMVLLSYLISWREKWKKCNYIK